VSNVAITTVIDFHTNEGTIVSNHPSPVLPAEPVKKKVILCKLDQSKFESKFSDISPLIPFCKSETALAVVFIAYITIEKVIKMKLKIKKFRRISKFRPKNIIKIETKLMTEYKAPSERAKFTQSQKNRIAETSPLRS
jgi:hypothetical protein